MSNNKAGAGNNGGGGSCLSEIQRLQRVCVLCVNCLLFIILYVNDAFEQEEITLCQLFRSEKKDVEIWSKLKLERRSNYKLYIYVCSVFSKLIFSWSGQTKSSVTERWEILEMLIFSAWFGNFVLEKKLLLNRYYYLMAVSLFHCMPHWILIIKGSYSQPG